MNRFITFVILLVSLGGCGHHLYHRVEPGETLYSVSWEYGYDYKQVADWNNIKPPYRIYKGQIIHLSPPKKEIRRGIWSTAYEPVAFDERVRDAPSAAVKRESSEVSTAKARWIDPSESAIRKPEGEAGVTARGSGVVRDTNDRAKARPVVWRWPAQGRVIADFKSTSSKLKGLDISGRAGQPVRSAAPGRVVYSGNGLKGYGNLIIIKHDERFLSAYAHNRDIFVSEGDEVEAGQRIAEMGDSDREGVALHFQIREAGKPVDPYRYLPKRQ